MEKLGKIYYENKSLFIASAAVGVGVASYMLYFKKHHRIHKLIDPFFNENVLSYSTEASAR